MPRRAAVISGAIDDERGSAHAYVVFKDEAAAEAALSLNMQLWEGAHLRVDRAGIGKYGNAATVNDQKGSTTGPAAYSAVYEPKRSVFLGNLTTTIEVRLVQFFYNLNLK